MLRTQTEAATSATETSTQQDVVEDFRDAAALEAALFSVQQDLEDSNQESAEIEKEWVEACLSVMQDLKHGGEILEKSENKTGTRRYPLRKRTNHVTADGTYTEGPKKRVVAGRKDVRRKRSTRSGKDPSASENEPCTSSKQTVEQNDGTSDTDMEPVLSSDHGKSGTVSVADDDVQMEDDSTEDAPEPLSIKKPTVSLQDVIASFKNWKKETPTAVNIASSLPPLSEGFTPEIIQPRAMQVEATLPGERNTTREDSSATKVYVMPSGYIVQSVQLVLAKKQAARIAERPPVFRPMFQPLLYNCKHQHPNFYIPAWQPLDSPSCGGCCVELGVQLKMTLSNPKSQPLGNIYADGDIDVGSFLSRLDETWSGWCLPQPSLGMEPLTQEAMEEQLHALLRDLDRSARHVENGSEDAAVMAETSSESPPTEIEKLLQNFSQRIEKFYEE